jgi:WD40 repeat protein
VATGDELARLMDFQWKVQCLAYSPDGRFLATGGGGFDVDTEMRGEVKLWNLATRTVAATFEGHSRAVLALAFSPDGQSLASGGLDNSSRIWNVASGELRVTIAGLPSCVQSLGFSRDGATLAWSGRGDGLVAIHDAKTGAEVARLVGHRNVVRSLAFSPDGLGLATGSADRTVRLWDLSSARSNASVSH